MSTELRTNTVVIGSGPGGYPCGIRLGQLGIDAIVVERGEPGGVCLNVGCIPSKALIHAAKSFEKLGSLDKLGIVLGDATPRVDMAKMQAWKGGIVKKLTSGVKMLLKANGTQLVSGTARLLAPDANGHRVAVDNSGEETVIHCQNVVLATGSRPIVIPGFEPDNERVFDSTGALGFESVPGRLVVIGGGYIGLELGMVYAKLGSKVTVVEALDTILAGMERDCVQVLERQLKTSGLEVRTKTRAASWDRHGDGALVWVQGEDGTKSSIEADAVLVSVGRRPNFESLDLSAVGLSPDGRGFVAVDDQLRTSVPNIFAIGDLAGGVLLAHKATKEGEVCAEVIAGKPSGQDAQVIAAVVFTDPEIASVGLTEDEALQAGYALKIGKFPFAALGRALSVGDTRGFTKVIADAATGQILGVHIVGNGASDLISEAALAIEMGAVLEDLALTIHPHPTLSESMMEAAAAALGQAIHVFNKS